MVTPVKLEVISEGKTHCFAGIGNVLISVYWAAPQADRLDDRIPWVERMSKTYGDGGLLVVVCDDATGALPDAKFRAKSRAQSLEHRGKITFSATVIEKHGVFADLLRGLLRGLAMVMAGEIETAFFDLEAPAVRWVEGRCRKNGGPTAAELRAALAEIRARRAAD